METLTLESDDGTLLSISKKAAYRSQLLKTILDDLGNDGSLTGPKSDTIPVKNVSTDILKMLVEWMTHHQNDSVPAEDNHGDDDILILGAPPLLELDSWDDAFLNVDFSTLKQIIVAADFMDVRDLVTACAKVTAQIMVGKTVEELREMFGVEDDLTDDEKRAVEQENRWCEEMTIVLT